MSAKISYSAAARADLLDIWLYIAQDNQDAADTQIDRIEFAIHRLTDFPEIGHPCEEAGSGMRVLLRDRYLIVYRHLVVEEKVVIERIAHGSRNLAALFD